MIYKLHWVHQSLERKRNSALRSYPEIYYLSLKKKDHRFTGKIKHFQMLFFLEKLKKSSLFISQSVHQSVAPQQMCNTERYKTSFVSTPKEQGYFCKGGRPLSGLNRVSWGSFCLFLTLPLKSLLPLHILHTGPNSSWCPFNQLLFTFWTQFTFNVNLVILVSLLIKHWVKNQLQLGIKSNAMRYGQTIIVRLWSLTRNPRARDKVQMK